ncbi:hypothetical protein DFH08DRAFT_940728 [Mycena albidolilacea]|uniref:Uncharacterized protein n=1 Tax=Mycena albidolilacea TaxID=1033008 RepID=A0AAD6ZLZ9_9AGAR|nr:hypothetical protein DFH08DRAFT_940728 [Mycena albidolilacea]
MPSRKVESLAEKILRLESKAKVIRAELGQSLLYHVSLSDFDALLATYKAEKASRPRKKLIPRPDGQHGTSKGYQIQKAMGLAKLGCDKKHYSRLSMQNKFKYFARFEGAWPLHDLEWKALQNCVRARKADEAAEKLAEEIDNSAEYERQDTRTHGKKKSQPEITSRDQEEEIIDSDADSDAQSYYGSDTADELTKPLAQVAVKNTARSKATSFLNAQHSLVRPMGVQADDETEPPTKKSVLVSKHAVSILRTTKSMEEEDEETQRAPAPVLKKAASVKNNKENTLPPKRKSETRKEEDKDEEPSRKKLKAADPLGGRASNDKISDPQTLWTYPRLVISLVLVDGQVDLETLAKVLSPAISTWCTWMIPRVDVSLPHRSLQAPALALQASSVSSFKLSQCLKLPQASSLSFLQVPPKLSFKSSSGCPQAILKSSGRTLAERWRGPREVGLELGKFA